MNPARAPEKVTPRPFFFGIVLVSSNRGIVARSRPTRKNRDDVYHVGTHAGGLLMDLTSLPGAPNDTDHLLRDAAAGDTIAIERLLDRYRERLRRMIALRLDDRLAARLDASDIVQETLADAARKLDGFVRDRPLPFYPWLHRLAMERLAAAHRRHRWSKARSVTREAGTVLAWPDSSAQLIVNRLTANDTTPSHALLRDEKRRQVHAALQLLAAIDREILMMHYLEELSFPEIAAILDIGEGAAKMRHLRALQRIRPLVAGEGSEVNP
jgi:RNA polymerase sigma-70 factor (ECF subfamily)